MFSSLCVTVFYYYYYYYVFIYNLYGPSVTTTMTSALRWAAMSVILMFHNCEGQNPLQLGLCLDHHYHKKTPSRIIFAVACESWRVCYRLKVTLVRTFKWQVFFLIRGAPLRPTVSVSTISIIMCNSYNKLCQQFFERFLSVFLSSDNTSKTEREYFDELMTIDMNHSPLHIPYGWISHQCFS